MNEKVNSAEIKALNLDTIISECLQTAFKIDEYCYLVTEAGKGGDFATEEFQKKFNAFYRVRQRSKDWYKTYYTLMQNQQKDNRSFKEILDKLYSVSNCVEASFSSKLLATINPKLPIWDQYVLKKLNLYKQWKACDSKPKEDRIKKANEIYTAICTQYDKFLKSEKGKEAIQLFDDYIGEKSSKISDTKKLDFMLWGSRMK